MEAGPREPGPFIHQREMDLRKLENEDHKLCIRNNYPKNPKIIVPQPIQL